MFVALVAVAALPPIFKLVTAVVELTENGAVPVATVDVNWLAKVLAPAKVCVPLVTTPPFEASAGVSVNTPPEIVPPFVLEEPAIAESELAPPAAPVAPVAPVGPCIPCAPCGPVAPVAPCGPMIFVTKE